MTQYWLNITSKENFELERNGNNFFVGVQKNAKGIIDKMDIGDLVAVYLAKGESKISGIFSVETKSFYDDSPIWKDEIYPYRVKLSPISISENEKKYFDFKKLINELKFIENKEKYGFYLKGSLKQISKEDFDLIRIKFEENLKKPIFENSNLRIIEDSAEIKKIQAKFSDLLIKKSDETIMDVRFGYYGGGTRGDAHWFDELRIYYGYNERDRRFWNVFGIEKPSENSKIGITCEINFPKNGANKKVAGAFAKNEKGDIFVLHRGNIGGGHKHVGKSLFTENYGGKWVEAYEGSATDSFALIGKLDDPNFIKDLSKFVFEIERIKGLINKEPEDNLRDLLLTVLDNYNSAKNEKFKGHWIPKVLKSQIPNKLDGIVGNKDKYSVKGSAGMGNWAYTPWAAIFDKEITISAKSGYYIVYLFKEDMNCVYLSLNQGVTVIDTEFGKPQALKILKDRAYEFRCKLGSIAQYNKNLLEEISLGNSDKSLLYEAGNVYAKYYDIDDFPSEEELEYDLKEFLELYNSLTSSSEENIVCKPVNIIKMLYDEFENTFYNSEEGIEHSQKYDIERQKVMEYYKLIGNNPQAKDNIQDPPINHLLPIKEPSVAPAAVGSITAYGYKNEDLPGLTEAVYNLLENLINTKDKDKQKELIKSFKAGPYANGFRSAMLSPVLYYLSPEFLLINQKTVDTFNFISEILEKEEKISVEMVDYIDNNQKLKNLLKNLSEYIPNLNFEKFDEFCHWMCYDKLGNYAKDNEKYNEWLLSNCPKNDEEKTNENAFLKFLKNIYRHEMQIALGELERGKNVILYGPPGSGKTVLSKIISEEYLGKNAYSLYTVHSGTDYYDLVCRIVPQIDNKGNLVYSKEKRFLLDALLSGKVLILDEINRTQIDTALGIFFTYLERDHRISDVEQIKALLKKEIGEELDSNDLKGKLSNFRIIGTLNVYDKTFLFKLGDALKRRFTFVEITTRNDLIENLVSSEEFKKEFTNACDYNGDMDIANTIIEAFADLNRIKPMGVGVLKDALQFSSYFGENAADLAISSLIIPFFENDLNYSNILGTLERYGLNTSVNKLKSLNFGTSDMHGI